MTSELIALFTFTLTTLKYITIDNRTMLDICAINFDIFIMNDGYSNNVVNVLISINDTYNEAFVDTCIIFILNIGFVMN